LISFVAKTNILVCVVGYYVPTWFIHSYEMFDRMFQHPDTVQCTYIHAYLYARLIFKMKQLFLNFSLFMFEGNFIFCVV